MSTTVSLNKEIGIGATGQITKFAPMVGPISPIGARSKFMKALIAEEEGRNEDAAALLDEAVALEVAYQNPK